MCSVKCLEKFHKNHFAGTMFAVFREMVDAMIAGSDNGT
jgi:hypothetical protein